MRAVTCYELEQIFLAELAKEDGCRDIQAVKIYPTAHGMWHLGHVRVGPPRHGAYAPRALGHPTMTDDTRGSQEVGDSRTVRRVTASGCNGSSRARHHQPTCTDRLPDRTWHPNRHGQVSMGANSRPSCRCDQRRCPPSERAKSGVVARCRVLLKNPVQI
jgi:hypothetical protein